jgi:hypothetical protein
LRFTSGVGTTTVVPYAQTCRDFGYAVIDLSKEPADTSRAFEVRSASPDFNGTLYGVRFSAGKATTSDGHAATALRAFGLAVRTPEPTGPAVVNATTAEGAGPSAEEASGGEAVAARAAAGGAEATPPARRTRAK